MEKSHAAMWNSAEALFALPGNYLSRQPATHLQGNISVAFSSDNRHRDGTEMQQKVRQWPN